MNWAFFVNEMIAKNFNLKNLNPQVKILVLICGVFFCHKRKNLAKSKIARSPFSIGFYGAPRGILTPNPWFRRPMLYTVELVEQNDNFFMGIIEPLEMRSEDHCVIHYTMGA